MMQGQPTTTDTARASILEKLVPSAALATVALSGPAGAVMMMHVFAALRSSESAGYAAVYGAMAEVHTVPAVILSSAAAIGAVGIIVAAIRMFTKNETASASGFLYIVPAAVSFVPPILTGLAGWYVIKAINTPASGGVSGAVDMVTTLNWASIGTAAFALLVLGAFAFIPFKGRVGRKFSPVLILLLIEFVIIAASLAFSMVMRMCYQMRDLY